jgi:hypothetical protein
MKTLKETTTKEGKRRLTIELDDGEYIRAIKENSFYRIGETLEYIVDSDDLHTANRVEWCVFTQEWVDL